MEIRQIEKACADSSITALMFLPYIKAAIALSEDSVKKHAHEALVIKSGECTLPEFHSLQDGISKLDITQADIEHIAHLSSIGFYFFNCPSGKDYSKIADSVLWLIKNDPQNYCLEMPYCTDFEQGSYKRVSLMWHQTVLENPKDVRIIYNAAQFFFMKDTERAKELLEQCIELEPNNSSWSDSLKELKEIMGDSTRD